MKITALRAARLGTVRATDQVTAAAGTRVPPAAPGHPTAAPLHAPAPSGQLPPLTPPLGRQVQ
jgi:hypothetical protein